jgi:tRNA (cytidine/uridine-2'-O-)-methyltransferase
VKISPREADDTPRGLLFFIVFLNNQEYKPTIPLQVVGCQQMETTTSLNIVLVEPEIPPNTGSIARLCGATNSVLHLVHPLGFTTDDKHLKRAGLDYWEHVTILHWQDFDTFLAAQREDDLYFFTTKVKRCYTEASYRPGSFLIFGKETRGLPEDILALYHDKCYTLPMQNPNIRSLNLAMTAGIVLYEAIRQITSTARP